MEIVYSDKDLSRYIRNAVEVDPDKPVLVDKVSSFFFSFLKFERFERSRRSKGRKRKRKTTTAKLSHLSLSFFFLSLFPLLLHQQKKQYLDRADEIDVDALCDKDGNVTICGIMQHIEQVFIGERSSLLFFFSGFSFSSTPIKLSTFHFSPSLFFFFFSLSLCSSSSSPFFSRPASTRATRRARSRRRRSRKSRSRPSGTGLPRSRGS